MYGGAGKLVAGLCAAAACLAFASPAGAAPVERSTDVRATFDIDGTRGYHLRFEVRSGDDESRVVVTATQGNFGSFVPYDHATYAARVPIEIAARSVAFKLPDGLGGAELQLDPKSVDSQEGYCGRRTAREGILSGRLDFRGEGGYTKVHEVDLVGTITVSKRRLPCGSDRAAPADLPKPEVPATRSLLSSCGPGKGSGFAAASFRNRAIYLAERFERAPRLEVFRFIFARGPGAGVHVSRDRETGTVRPPRPFEGIGRFRNGRLVGDLTATFPGAKDVSLASSRARIRDLRNDLPDCFPPLF